MVSHPESANHPHDERAGLIRTQQLAFQAAGTDAPLLEDVSLRIEAGERVGIIGPSGSGKTTLALHLTGLHHVALLGHTSGRLWLNGRDCTSSGCEGFAGVVLQNPEIQLFGETVEEEVSLSLQQRTGDFDRQRELRPLPEPLRSRNSARTARGHALAGVETTPLRREHVGARPESPLARRAHQLPRRSDRRYAVRRARPRRRSIPA